MWMKRQLVKEFKKRHLKYLDRIKRLHTYKNRAGDKIEGRRTKDSAGDQLWRRLLIDWLIDYRRAELGIYCSLAGWPICEYTDPAFGVGVNCFKCTKCKAIKLRLLVSDWSTSVVFIWIAWTLCSMGTLILFQILMCALVVGDWYLVLMPRSVEIYVSVLFLCVHTQFVWPYWHDSTGCWFPRSNKSASVRSGNKPKEYALPKRKPFQLSSKSDQSLLWVSMVRCSFQP